MSQEGRVSAKTIKSREKKTFSKEHRYLFLQDIPFFGIEHPSVNEAAELIVTDMVFSGYYAKKVPKKFDGNPRNPMLLKALSKEIEEFKDRLVSAIKKGQLKADPLKLDLDDNLIPEICHIKSQDVIDWLAKRGYRIGDIFSEYSKNEFKILDHVCKEILYKRTVQEGDPQVEGFKFIQCIEKDPEFKKPKIKNLVQLYKSAIAENQLLLEKIHEQPAIVDVPIHTRTRRTMLTIIAALCEKAEIEYRKRGAAGEIRSATAAIGAQVDDETVRKLLDEIEDAVDTRLKDTAGSERIDE